VETVLFVCPHGAGKSRIAAAIFNALAAEGWSATTAGIEPQDRPSLHAPRLLAGTPAADRLDPEPPRPVGAVAGAAPVVAIDCDLPGAIRWSLANQEFEPSMVDEITARVTALAHDLGAARG